MTLPLYDGANLQFILDLVAQSTVDTGGRRAKLRFGAATLAFSASTTASVTVPHGMGSTPIAAVAIARNSSGIYNVTNNGIDDTDLVFVGRHTDGSSTTANITIYWIALG